MYRNCFEILHHMLHFSNINKVKEGDRQAKISLFWYILDRNFQQAYTPGLEIVIDECNDSTEGKATIQTVYTREETQICYPKGFTRKTKIYSGKSGGTRNGLSETVVLYLREGLLNEGTLYTDNFDTSVNIIKTLFEKICIWLAS